jgi:hypothetical protein
MQGNVSEEVLSAFRTQFEAVKLYVARTSSVFNTQSINQPAGHAANYLNGRQSMQMVGMINNLHAAAAAAAAAGRRRSRTSPR